MIYEKEIQRKGDVIMRKILKILSHRMFTISFLILLQIGWFMLLFLKLTSYNQLISAAFKVLSVLVVIYLARRSDNPAVKMAWIVVILLFPLFGGFLYLYIGGKKPIRHMRKKLEPTLKESSRYLVFDDTIAEELEQKDASTAGQVYYLEHQSGFPAYRDSDAQYYPSGEACFEAMLEDLQNAKEYILKKIDSRERERQYNNDN